MKIYLVNGHFILKFTFSILITRFGDCAVHDSNLFPYDEYRGDTRYNFGDDDFIDYKFDVPFNFFNITYPNVFISGNGQVSFGTGLRTYTPDCTPSSTPMIMVFWADSDNRRDPVNGKLLYRETTDKIILQRAHRDVSKAFPDLRSIKLSWAFIVTWKELPYYGSQYNETCIGVSKRNTFQLVLASDRVHSFALMYYNKIEWTTGTASRGNCYGLGGVPAKAGFDFGDSKTWYTISGSCTNSILNIPQTSNIGEPGKWVFRIDHNLRKPTCEEFDEKKQKLKLTPSIVSPYGNEPLTLEGPCITPNDTFICIYSEKYFEEEREGVVLIDSMAVVCPMPFFDLIGRISVSLKVISPQNSNPLDERADQIFTRAKVYSGYLYIVNDRVPEKDLMQVSFEKSSSQILIATEWTRELLETEIEQLVSPTSSREPLDLILESYDGRSWRELGLVKSNVPNNGSYSGKLDNTLLNSIKTLRRPELLTVSLSRPQKNNKIRYRWKKIFANPVAIFSNLYKVLATNPEVYGVAGVNASMCIAWSYLSETLPPRDTRACPPTKQLAMIDENFEGIVVDKWMSIFHPHRHYSVRQRIPSSSGAGSTCVYGSTGHLILGAAGGGTLSRYSPNYSVWRHLTYDVIPFLYCCKLPGLGPFKGNKCNLEYYKLRPSDDGGDYTRLSISRAVGDPHITTFDGLTYTFNGIGEFWLVKMEDYAKMTAFKMQARMERYTSTTGSLKSASVITAVATEETRDGDKQTLQVSYSDESILIEVDGEVVEVDKRLLLNGLSLHYKTFQIYFNVHNDIRVAFSSGFSFKFSIIGLREVALNIIGMASVSKTAVIKGLMGNGDGKMDNDLTTQDGAEFSTRISVQQIHNSFGLKWRVNEPESIFTYRPGKTYAHYSNPNFTPTFSYSQSQIQQSITDACQGDKYCEFDYMTTGSREVAVKTKDSALVYKSLAKTASNQIEMCPSVTSQRPENGYVLVTNLLVGSVAEFHCNYGTPTPQRLPVKCKCEPGASQMDPPDWNCNPQNPFPIRCPPKTKEIDMKPKAISCDAPPFPENGYVVGTDFSVGSTIELYCDNEDDKHLCENCKSNGEVDDIIICDVFCYVTYTCVQKNTLVNSSIPVQATWEGVAGDINKVGCTPQ